MSEWARYKDTFKPKRQRTRGSLFILIWDFRGLVWVDGSIGNVPCKREDHVVGMPMRGGQPLTVELGWVGRQRQAELWELPV